jgi:hypothetical protein
MILDPYFIITNFSVDLCNIWLEQQLAQQALFVAEIWLAGAPLPDGAQSTSASLHPARITIWDYG